MTYVSKIAGWIDGKRVTVGQPVELTEAQAKYEPVEIAPVSPKATTRPRKIKAENGGAA